KAEHNPNFAWKANLKPCYRLCLQETTHCEPRRLHEHEIQSPLSVWYWLWCSTDWRAFLLFAVGKCGGQRGQGTSGERSGAGSPSLVPTWCPSWAAHTSLRSRGRDSR